MIEIYRFKNYINCVDNRDELIQWVRDNVPYQNQDGVLPPTYTDEKCLKYAQTKGYSFVVEKTNKAFTILERVKIEDVAREFFDLKRRGENYICDCPFCGRENIMAISPKYQIYKCYGCEKSGNAIHLVMDVKKIAYDEAIQWLNDFIQK